MTDWLDDLRKLVAAYDCLDASESDKAQRVVAALFFRHRHRLLAAAELAEAVDGAEGAPIINKLLAAYRASKEAEHGTP